jgi:dinuclear metal center YbgI/SA1388 family protein
MRVGEIYDFLNELSPFELQEKWDNSGLIVGSFDDEIKKVYISLDLDLEMIKNIEPNSLIITHHPLIFSALKKINNDSYSTKILKQLIKKDIVLISMHTNIDKTHLNTYVGNEILGFDFVAQEDGFVLTAEVNMSFEKLQNHVKNKLGMDILKVVQSKQDIKRVALTTGSGMSLLPLIKADCFLTGDIKYHEAMEAKARNISLIDIGHFESEIHFSSLLEGLISDYLKKNEIKAIITASENPFTYKAIKDEDTALKKIEELLVDSVEQRLKSDVEVGTLLSGGIDSSLVSTIYSQHTNHQINTFSVGYKSHKKYSELPYANLVAKNINSNHLALEIEQKDFIESLDAVFENLEEPHADPAAIPLFHLTNKINKQGIKTVLSGEGSDELFLGYDNYAKFLKYYKFADSVTSEQNEFLDDIIGALQTNTKESEYLRRVVKKQNIYNSFGEIYTESQRKRLLKKVATFKTENPKKDPVDWMSYIDMKIWLGEALLSKVDKICMANSVENRNPFLDYRLVDTVFSIDSKLKVGDTNKYLLKKVASKYIPSEIINRTKKGFNSPFNEWLFEEYGERLLDEILYVNKQSNLFNETYVRYIYNEALNNRFKQHFYALWHFVKWYKKNYLY